MVMTMNPGTEEARTQRQPISLPAEINHWTPRGSSRLLQLEAPGYWSPPLLLVGESRESPITLSLYPAARVSGHLEVPRGQDLPEEVELRLEVSSRAPADAADPPIPRTAVRCPTQEGGFACTVPAMRLDLRIAAEGFVPHYRWDVSPEAGGELPLGTLKLATGGSVVGWLEAGEPGALEGRPAQVVLERASASVVTSSAERQRFDRSKLEAASTASGFFQLAGVPPGEYRLVATHPKAGEGSFFPLRVEADRETALPHPVKLYPPAPIRAGVSPPQDPLGQPWKISVLEFNHSRTAVRSQLQGTVDEGGFWTSRPLSPGPYLVTLASSDGARWQQEEVEVAGVPREVDFLLQMVEVEGRVLLGSEPAAGHIVFGGRRGATSVPMESDEGGEFEGLLPHAGKWRVEVLLPEPKVEKLLTLEVEEPEGGRPARVEIRLGDGRIEGQVVDAEGREVAGASVWLAERFEGSAGPRITTSDSQGEFSFPGVEEGEHFLMAYRFSPGGQEATEEARVEVAEDHTVPRVELRLEAHRRLEGIVLSPAGPVPGADVSVDLPSEGGRIQPSTTTDVEGRFSLEVPTSEREVTLTVLPPGFALTCRRLFIPEEGPLAVPVSDLGGRLILRGTAVARRGSFRGFTLSQDGAPCGMGAVSRWLNAYGQKGEDLLFDRLAIGLYQACWRDVEAPEGGSPHCEEDWLPPGGELELDLTAPGRADGGHPGAPPSPPDRGGHGR